jgi:D-ribose pyranase
MPKHSSRFDWTMKSGILIQPGLPEMHASLGHTSDLLICDAGYPVPPGIRTIDLAYRPGDAAYLGVLSVVVATMHVDRAAIAGEAGHDLATAIDADRIPHASLKELARSCEAWSARASTRATPTPD